ncbi:MAG: hypothetical protein JNN30_06950 [Rhodanobacteraceae bacterium]|nr:hypothetical protein [Rhodanobacteraceae bacterium]
MTAEPGGEAALENTQKSAETLISTSGVMASIGLAIVGILGTRTSAIRAESIADDIFLFASLGFIFVIAAGYLAQKKTGTSRADKLVATAEWIFSLALLGMVVGALILVYAEA